MIAHEGAIAPDHDAALDDAAALLVGVEAEAAAAQHAMMQLDGGAPAYADGGDGAPVEAAIVDGGGGVVAERQADQRRLEAAAAQHGRGAAADGDAGGAGCE